MKTYLNSNNNKLMQIITMAIYFSITCAWNLLPIDGMIDIIFFLIVALILLYFLGRKIVIPKQCLSDYIAILFMVIFALLQLLYAMVGVEQTIFETLLTIREILYIIVFFLFASKKYDYSRCLKNLILFECIGSVLYFITLLMGQTLSPVAHYKSAIVQVGTFYLYRDFAPVPLMASFFCPYIFWGIINHKYIWNKRKDFICLCIILAGILAHLFRTKFILLLFGMVLVSLFGDKRNYVLTILKKLLFLGIGLVILILIGMNFKIISERFLDGFYDILYAFSGKAYDPFYGSFTYRMWLLRSRFVYLINHNKLLFGLGAISSRNNIPIFGGSMFEPYMLTVYNPDNAYMTLIARFGIIGTMFYIGILIFFVVRLLKQRTRLSVATGIYLICAIIEGMTANGVLCESALLIIGTLIGMCQAEKNLNYNYSDLPKDPIEKY